MEQKAVGRTIVRKKKSEESPLDAMKMAQQTSKEHVQVAKLARKKDLISRAEVAANSKICLLNWKFDQAAEKFPREPWMRKVDFYFPYAAGGPLLVDDCKLPHQVTQSERKAKILQELGYRFLILRPGMTEADDLLELEKCGQHLPKQ